MKTTNTAEWQRIRDSFFLAATIDGKSPKTISLYELVINRFVDFMSPRTPLETTPNDIRLFLLGLQERGYAKTYQFTHYKEIKVLLNFLVSEGHLEKSPMAGIKGPKLPRCYPYVLSEEEIDLLVKAARGTTFEAKRNYAILLFFVDTGVRVSELTNLSLDDVKLATYIARVDGKTGERIVHFGKTTAKALSAYLKARGFIAHEDANKGRNRMTRSGVLQMIRKLGKKANIIGKRVSPHTLRHTAATFWIKNGGDTVSLRRQLGHVDPRMVDVYVNLVGKDLAEAHRKYSPLKRLR